MVWNDKSLLDGVLSIERAFIGLFSVSAFGSLIDSLIGGVDVLDKEIGTSLIPDQTRRRLLI